MSGKPKNKKDLFIVWDDPGGNPREASDRSERGQFCGTAPRLVLPKLTAVSATEPSRLFICYLPPVRGCHSLLQFSSWVQEQEGYPRDRNWMSKGGTFPERREVASPDQSPDFRWRSGLRLPRSQ